MKRMSIYKSWKTGEWEVLIREANKDEKLSVHLLSDTHGEIVYEVDDEIAFAMLKAVIIEQLDGNAKRYDKLIREVSLLTPKLSRAIPVPVIVGDRVFLLYEQVHAYIESIYSDKDVSYILSDNSIRVFEDFVIDNDLTDVQINDNVLVWVGGHGVTSIVDHCDDTYIFVDGYEYGFSRQNGKQQTDQTLRIVRKL